MASTIKVDKIEGSTGSTVTIPTGQTLAVTDGIGISSLPTITVAKGGTNLTSFAAGDVLYATGATTLAKLPKGAAANVLTMNSGATAPEWAAAAGGGKIGQIQYAQITDTESTTSTSYATIPTLQATITPSASNSLILITCYLSWGGGDSIHTLLQLFRDTTQIAMGDADGSRDRTTFAWRSQGANMSYSGWPVQFQWIDNPADTSAHTYSMKWRVNSGTTFLGRSWDNTDHANYNRSPCSIAAWEILA